jgi:hypothetical protein
MKRSLLWVLPILAFGIIGCTKGTIEGKVINPFTGKPIAGAVVQLPGTTKQPVTTDANGSFSFPELKIQDYKLVAGMNNFSKSEVSVSLTKEANEITKDLFIYNRKEEIGLYAETDTGMVKVPNFWVSYEVNCGDGKIAYLPTMTVEVGKEKKVSDMPAAIDRPLSGSYLLYEKSSATALPELKIAALKKVNASESPACAAKAKGAKTFLVADMNSAETIQAAYKSNSLYEVNPSLQPGEQLLYFYQAGKPLKGYLINAK